MNNYKDVTKKIDYHRQRILLEFVKKGIYPSNEAINSRLKAIDSYLAVFKNYNVKPGNLFNADEFNERSKQIYSDLTFLYELLHELTVIEFNKLQSFVNSHLSELGSIVETYNKKAEYENNSTTLGKTLLFKNNSFSVEDKDSITKVDLGTVEMHDASTIAGIANINNVKAEDIIFKFKEVNSETWLNVSAYNYNNDMLKVPGENKTKKHEYSMKDNQVFNGPLLLDIGAVDIKNRYSILGGKNKILVNYKDDNGYTVEEKPISIDSLYIDKKAFIDFYIVDGNSITFKFNKNPIATNFSIDNNRIDNLKTVHHFFIECDKDFAFEFSIDKGEVFAVREKGVVSEDKLYYTGTNLVKDFIIIENSLGALRRYDAVIEAHNSNEDIDIDSIIIKELGGGV